MRDIEWRCGEESCSLTTRKHRVNPRSDLWPNDSNMLTRVDSKVGHAFRDCLVEVTTHETVLAELLVSLAWTDIHRWLPRLSSCREWELRTAPCLHIAVVEPTCQCALP